MALAPQFNTRVIAQLESLENIGHIMPLPAAQYGAKQARGYAPVDTGYMRDHIHAQKDGEDSAVIVSEATYSGFVEWGTVHMAAQPFIRPAIADMAIHVPEMSAKDVNREIRRRVSRA